MPAQDSQYSKKIGNKKTTEKLWIGRLQKNEGTEKLYLEMIKN